MLGPGAPEAATSATLLRFIRQGRSFSGHERHCAFLNLRDGHFADVSSVAGLDLDDDGRAIGQVDWDHDGDLDYWVSNRNAPQVRFLRNDYSAKNSSLAIRLVGKQCNRDAIGARVAVVLEDTPKQPLVQTVRAGDGYLAQSSKWLHLGLGSKSRIGRVIVHWPGGSSETFDGIRPGTRNVLVQGAGHSALVDLPTRQINLQASPTIVPEFEATSELTSAARLPLPVCGYETADGRRVRAVKAGQPTLLMLWASWCLPCRAELKELVDRQAEVARNNLHVVAISVDALDPSDASGPLAARELLDSLDFPFATGWANDRLLDVLQMMHDQLFDLHLPLPVPVSFLIDREGHLAGLYKGRTPLDRVLADIKRSEMDAAERRDASVPFEGIWAGEPQQLSRLPILESLIDMGYLGEADEYVRRLGEAPKKMLVPLIVRLGIEFQARGYRDKAMEHFRVAKSMDPTDITMEIRLGLIFEKRGQFDQARQLYESALKQNSNSTQALNNLAWLLATSADDQLRDPARALELARQAYDLTNGRQPSLIDTLAATHAANGEFVVAAKTAQTAIDLARTYGQLELAAKIESRRELYRAQQPYRRPVSSTD